ncbi:hypothetical protein N8837_01100 [Pseudomonadales bacterium]|nr:hypothetical protein [Pseudomonadales bacterium]
MLNNLLRGIEKIPGVNLQQVLVLGDDRFILTPKVGSRAIRNALLDMHDLCVGGEWQYIEYHTKRSLVSLLEKQRVYIVLRDPLPRLHSCWKQKVYKFRDRSLVSYFWIYFPLIRRDMSFLSFLKAVKIIPPSLSEKHFRPVAVTVDLSHHNLVKIRLNDLNAVLRKQSRANMTPDVEVPKECIEYFNENLAKRYECDAVG